MMVIAVCTTYTHVCGYPVHVCADRVRGALKNGAGLGGRFGVGGAIRAGERLEMVWHQSRSRACRGDSGEGGGAIARPIVAGGHRGSSHVH